ncbi:PLP-dependent aminotransferase family protein [Nitrospirillum iridis]|uniref:DNA-binding transcriptional MocR family regulator n=1 Tax=Nitrospirillum iridis TaxID=765888 RepID=A0A7X0AXF4_9PROT|nr:PLP-dependent aminotransferase family protein [Nitrospirillum iridis]MBB6250431.1 DNA-binding transcriptional MocR family regulator [Nitrospirillum iridis]
MADIRARVDGRLLPPGARAPSIRDLAQRLGVSKSTVVEAYDRLVAEGVLAARPGSGFYVAKRVAPLALMGAALAGVDPPPDRAVDPLWLMRQALEPGEGVLKPGCGWLPGDWMPEQAIRRAFRALARAPAAALLEYDTPLGHPPLRRHLADRFASRGITAGAEQILLTDSGSQAIDLICRYLLEPGDAVLLDDPCYYNFKTVVAAHRARAVPVPYTPTGPDLTAFAQAAATHRPRLYITNAALHNPTGASLTAPVAHKLLTCAAAHDILIVEDDIFSDFEAEPTPRLAAFDGLERVIHIGSFSKTLSAAVRCGYVVARGDWIQGIADVKLATAFGNATTNPRVVHQLLTDGSYRRHMEGVRGRLAEAMGRTLRRLDALGLRPWTEPRGGMFLWAALPPGVSSVAVARQALEQGVVLAPGDVFSLTNSADGFLRFNVAQCDNPRIFEVLARALEA